MTAVLDQLGAHEDLAASRAALHSAIEGLADTSTWLGGRLAAGDLTSALAGASPYLRQFGTIVGGWLMALSAVAAKEAPSDFTPEFLTDKVTTARFFMEHLLPQANGLIPTIKGGADLLTDARL
jgi:hypothetical protein